MENRLVTIARFADSIDAEMARQLLADFGIRAVVTGQNVANVYSGVPSLLDLKLQTLESQAQRAREILESNDQQEK